MSEFNRGAACYLFIYPSLLIVESQQIMREDKKAGHQLVSYIILNFLLYIHAMPGGSVRQ